MKNKINEFINFIKEKTSVSVSVYDLTGNLILGDKYAKPSIDCAFNDIKVDEDGDYTAFKINLSGSELIALISGVDGYAVKIARLITELAKSFAESVGTLTKKQFFVSLLFNELNFSVVEKNIKKYKVPNEKCFATLVLLPSDRTDEVEGVLEDYIGDNDVVVKTTTDTLTVVRFFGDDNEYKSSTEYADFLLKSIYEECGIKGSAFTGLTVRNAFELSQSYSLAVESKICAEILGKTGSAHSFKEHILTKAVRELPSQKTDEYFRLLMGDEVGSMFSDEELIETAETFLDCNLNASETARKLFVHRNTLTYRLDKIERVTGLNIRNFSDSVTFRFMTILYRASKR